MTSVKYDGDQFAVIGSAQLGRCILESCGCKCAVSWSIQNELFVLVRGARQTTTFACLERRVGAGARLDLPPQVVCRQIALSCVCATSRDASSILSAAVYGLEDP